MASFKKNYKTEPNQEQIDAIRRCFLVMAQRLVAEGYDVVININTFEHESIIAELSTGDATLSAFIIGPKGGLKVI